jgi:N-acetylmuramoyl-L-alanine amidase
LPEHTISQGECLASIARQYGLLADTIWTHPQNDQLREQRTDPHVLLPGDVLFIPESQERRESGATESRHRFRRLGLPARIRVRFLQEGEPRANEPFQLVIDGRHYEGETDADGWLEHPIPPDARHGQVILVDTGEEYTLDLGHLDPVDEVTGVQQRLQNLGIYSGEVDGEMGPATEDALRLFQQDHDLEPTGQLDDATRDALREGHSG